MKTTQRRILEALGFAIGICTALGVFIYGALMVGNGTNPVLGCWMIGIMLFIAVFVAVYFGRD